MNALRTCVNRQPTRRDTVELVKQAVAEDRRAAVLVNNRSEGNAPLMVQALVDYLSRCGIKRAVPRKARGCQ